MPRETRTKTKPQFGRFTLRDRDRGFALRELQSDDGLLRHLGQRIIFGFPGDLTYCGRLFNFDIDYIIVSAEDLTATRLHFDDYLLDPNYLPAVPCRVKGNPPSYSIPRFGLKIRLVDEIKRG